MHVVTSIAGQLGMAVENARLYKDLENTFLGTISALAAAVDAKDPYTAGHSNEVTVLAVSLAEALGLDAPMSRRSGSQRRCTTSARSVSTARSCSSRAASPNVERDHINRHPAIGADILAPLEFLRDTVPLVLFHHERYSGGGYPSGISRRGDPVRRPHHRGGRRVQRDGLGPSLPRGTLAGGGDA